MKTSTTLILLLISVNSFCQINFDKKPANNDLYRNALLADSAIKAGAFGDVHSLLVVKGGKLAFEGYYNGWHKDTVHQLQSVTKSIVATLLGCALQNGFIHNEQELISKYYPDFSLDGTKQKITIQDLLTQRHGMKWKEFPWDDPDNNWRKVLETEGNWYELILKTPMDTVSGSMFNYSSAAPVLTAGIIQNASKMNIDIFAEKYLFSYLDITNYRFWQGNGGAQNNGMALLSLTSRDMAKIGQLYLQKGKWNNVQVIPESFVEAATSPMVKNAERNGFYSSYDYGYFWWSNPVTNDNLKSNVFLARGAGGQNIIVSPEQNMVVVITAWNMQQPNKVQTIFENYLQNNINEIEINAILKTNREMEKAFMENDFLKVASFYADNAVLTGNKHEVKGRQAVDEYWNKLKDRGISWNLENIHIEVYENIAIQRGISRMKFLHEGKEHLSEVRFTLVWKKINNKWLIEIDHYSLL